MGSLVIVALPAKDDYVHKISSEKIPHVTILFLGEDSSKVENVADILNFTKHAADTTLTRFGMEVDRREVLGENEADVLFFAKTKWSGYAAMRDFRANLLKDDNIRKAYDSSEQFPEWLPHLTLGYPDTPAKPDERDYPGISYVNFDRIAVWFGDYDGIEFPLKAYEWDAMDVVEDILAHVGVKGMKWGVRNARNNSSAVTVIDKKKKIKTFGGKGRSAHPEAIRVRSIGQVAKKSGTKALSNKDLDEYNKRLNLEQNYKRLSYQDKNPGQKFVASLLGQTGKTQAQNVANDVAAGQVKKHITSKLIKG